MNWVCLAQRIPCCLSTVRRHRSQAHELHGQGPDLAGVVPESSPVTEWVIPSNAGIQRCKVSFSADVSHVLHSQFYLFALFFYFLIHNSSEEKGCYLSFIGHPLTSPPNLWTHISLLCFPLSSRPTYQLSFKEFYMVLCWYIKHTHTNPALNY